MPICPAMLAVLVGPLPAIASTPPTLENISGGILPTAPAYGEEIHLSGDGLTITTNTKRWRRNEGWTAASGSGTFFDLSADGATVVGTLANAPYVWRFGGTNGTLPTTAAISTVRGRGVNRDGTHLFGQALLTGTSSNNALVEWPASGPPAVYPMPDPFRTGTLIVSDVSGYGNCTVGIMAQPPAPGRLTHGWVWRPNVGVTDMGVPPPYVESWAQAVSEYGDIIAGIVLTPGPGTVARWTPSGVQIVGNLMVEEPSILSDEVLAMSADGAVMVGVGGNPLDRRAWLWTRTLGLVDLNTYLPALGVDTTGFTLGMCMGVSDDYRTLFGVGHLNGSLRMWLVTNLPRPSGTPCGPADIGAQGGVHDFDGALDNNDFVVFIDDFFTHDPHADRGRQGGLLGADYTFDNNDFVVFIDQFFAGCPQ
jgi:hypothetical protein